jgi:hypothetical protein
MVNLYFFRFFKSLRLDMNTHKIYCMNNLHCNFHPQQRAGIPLVFQQLSLEYWRAWVKLSLLFLDETV